MRSWTYFSSGRKTGKTRWQHKQQLAFPSRFYGDGGTIHSNGELDVMVDDTGTVQAVWFRCLELPFRQGEARPGEGKTGGTLPRITGVEVLDQVEIPDQGDNDSDE